MKLTLSDQLTQFMRVMQGALFPALQEELEPLTEKHRQLVALLNMVRIEVLIRSTTSERLRNASSSRPGLCRKRRQPPLLPPLPRQRFLLPQGPRR
jgi:hypothetical protein